MLEIGVIAPSTSEWSFPPVLVRKKDGSLRWCLDYRDLNDRTRKDSYDIPNISECTDFLSDFMYLSSLDMASGYWQVEIDEADRHKTAFSTKYGLFEHIRMAFGLCNAPATFQRIVSMVLKGMLWHEILAYLDDVLVKGKNFIDHTKNLFKTFARFHEHNLKLKPKKCHLFQHETVFLGHLVTQEGMKVNPDNISKVQDWPVPQNVREVESFLGFANYHRQHIRDYAKLTEPMYRLTGAKAKKITFNWTGVQQQAFDKLKEVLTSTPVLAYPKNDPDCRYVLDCDASDHAIGGVLSLVENGVEKPVCFGSYVLTPCQRRYCTTRKELLAIIRFTRQFRHYLLGRQFLLRTDHNSLVWLTRFRNIEGQLARWLEELSQYDYLIVHRAGVAHNNADGMSRLPDMQQYCECYRAGKSLKELPCGGCTYCTRAHTQWARFEDEVDNILPLSLRQIGVEGLLTRNREGMLVQLGEFSAQELKEAQTSDQDLSIVIDWVEHGYEPSQGELYAKSPAIKYYWAHKSLLELEREILYYRWEFPNGLERRLFVVPRGMVPEVLKLGHDSRFGGHLGQAKTLLSMRRSCLWYGMRKDTNLYVKSCNICSRQKAINKKPKAGLKSFHAAYPMHRVHMDILGPLTPSQSGHQYILMMVDQFTKWLEVVPLHVQTAEVIATAAMDSFFSRFGNPTFIHTDQGRNFVGETMHAVCDLLQVTKTRTTAYRPCSNGQVERYNRTLLQLIRCFLRENQQMYWDRDLQQLAGVIRSIENSQTGQSANMMMLGREVCRPLDLMLGVGNCETEKHVPAYVQEVRERMLNIHGFARRNIQGAQLRQKRLYDMNVKLVSYKVGDAVLEIDSSVKVGHSKKLKSLWKGPYLVLDVISPILLRVTDNRNTKVVHHDRLRLCEDRASTLPQWLKKRRYLLSQKPHERSQDDAGEEKLKERASRKKLEVDYSGIRELFSMPGNKRVKQITPGEALQLVPEQHMALPERVSRTGRAIKPPARFRNTSL